MSNNFQYGAPMGAHEVHAPSGTKIKFRLCKVRLNNGGYDSLGRYWGVGGDQLYVADGTALVAAAPNPYFHLRAISRADARNQVLAKYPNARFYR